MIDTKEGTSKTIATTHTWNVQQGCMAQWLGPKYDKEIIYNDFQNGKYVSVVLNVFTGEERVLNFPVYSVALDGSFALTLDFSRLHRLRPGYGYSNIEDITKGEKIPDSVCIWKLDIKNNTVTPVLKYSDFASFETRSEMKNAEHKVNHIMISPNGKRFMVLHRWLNGQRKYSRLVTVDVDGSNMYKLSDDNMVSHCYWKDDENILAFESKKGIGTGYFLMKDKTQEFEHLWPDMNADGHPSYSPDGRMVVTDTYPDGKRIATLKVLTSDFIRISGKVFAPFKYDNDTRCDLHPRWSRDGKRIYFDSVHENHRGLYSVNVPRKISKDTIDHKVSISVIVPCYNAEKTIGYTLQSLIDQTIEDFEVVVVNDGSTDNSLNIIEQYKDRLNISIISQDNLGVSAARNSGIKAANGDYITFLDADDMYYPEYFEVMLSAIKNNDCDIVISKYEKSKEYLKEYRLSNYKKEFLDKYSIYDRYNYKRIYLFNFCNCLYKTAIISQNDICFKTGIKYGEDSLFFLEYLYFCDKGGVYIDSTLYKYIESEVSASKARNIQRMQIIQCFIEASKMWEKDVNYNKKTGQYSVDRAIWAQAKDFAITDAKLLSELRAKYDVKSSMKRLVAECDEGMVKISAGFYLISPALFISIMRLYKLLKEIK